MDIRYSNNNGIRIWVILSVIVLVCVGFFVFTDFGLGPASADTATNDDFVNAELITPGKTNGSIDSQDTADYYKLELDKDGLTVYVNATIPLTLEVSVSLYDKSQNEIDWQNNVKNDEAKLSHTFETAQTVFIEIKREYEGGEGAYDLEITVLGQNDANSGSDAGSDFVTALSITLGTYTNNFLKPDDKIDFYSLTLTAPGQTIFVNVTIPLELEVSVYLYDKSQYEMDSQSAVINDVARLSHTFETAQTVYIKVQRDYDGGEGFYDLEVAIVDQNDANSGGDAGNDFADALSITPAKYTNCFLKLYDGVDYYYFSTTAPGQTVYAQATIPAELKASIYLYDESQYEVDSESNLRSKVGELSHTFQTAQTIYFKVSRDYDGGEGFYDFKITIVNQNDGNSGGDAGDNFASASPITVGAYRDCFIKLDDREDYYSLTLTQAGQTVYVNATVPQELKVNVYLYDKSEYEVAYQSDIRNDVAQLSYTFETAQTVYIKVARSYEGGEGFYQLEVAVPGIAMDITPPLITHTPITESTVDEKITITATISDEVNITEASLNYRVTSTTSFKKLAMTSSGETYTAEIPATDVTAAGVEYYISVKDGPNLATHPATNPKTNPHSVSITITTIKPQAPTGLSVTAGDKLVTLSWSTVKDAAGYNIYRSETSGSGFTKINPTLITTTTYKDSTVSNDITYYYYATAIKDSEESEPSKEISAKPTSGVPAPKDSDGDNFNDDIEARFGTDKDDPKSYPGSETDQEYEETDIGSSKIQVLATTAGSVTITKKSESEIPKPTEDAGDDFDLFFEVTSDENVTDVQLEVYLGPIGGGTIPNGTDPKSIKLFYFDEDKSIWVEIEGSSYNSNTYILSGKLTHLTVFAPMSSKDAGGDKDDGGEGGMNTMIMMILVVIIIVVVIVIVLGVVMKGRGERKAPKEGEKEKK